MDEPDDGMNLAIFNAEGALFDDHQLEIVRNSYHTQKFSQAYVPYDQLVYPLIFWTGSGGCGMEDVDLFIIIVEPHFLAFALRSSVSNCSAFPDVIGNSEMLWISQPKYRCLVG
jgi:hypothetical protein